MSSLFGSSSPPPPQPVPVAPAADASVVAGASAAAEKDAAITANERGRRSTIVGGMAMAQDDQYARGLLNQKRRAAA